MNFLIVMSASLVALVAVHSVAFFVGYRIGRYNVVDVAWGLGFLAVALVCAGFGSGDLTRRLLLLGLIGIWAGRLSWHMAVKSAGKGEDLRYRDLLGDDFSVPHVLRKIFVIQAAATWLVSVPIQRSAVEGPTPEVLQPVLAAGITLWIIGMVFEGVGDYQLRRFKQDPANKNKVMDRGLWAWTRHPNYFGDSCVWWGLWLITITGWQSLATLPYPVLMTYFLVHATGGRRTEKVMAGRPGFEDYQRRVSFFLPRPPKRGSP